MEKSNVFLTNEWIHEVTHAVQSAKNTDKKFGKLVKGFSLTLLYVVTDLPPILVKQLDGEQCSVLVQLEKGVVRKLDVGTKLPEEKCSFTVSSKYSVVKQIFQGELNPATAFIDKQLHVEPIREVYRRPAFTAKAIITGNAILKIAKQVPTQFPDDIKRLSLAHL